MPEQGMDPRRAVEITGPSYGSGYRIGGRLVLTARHLFAGSADNTCKVRARYAFGEVKAQVAWKAPGADVALVELPKDVPACDSVVFGRLPVAGQTARTITFEFYGWPQWARTTRLGESPKAGGRHIRGTIYLADTSPEGLLVVEPERVPWAPDSRAQGSEWTGVSGAAVVCHGLVVAVQHHHQNSRRAASLEAELLSKVYDDPTWRSLLEQHGIHGDPVAVVLDEPSKRQQEYGVPAIKIFLCHGSEDKAAVRELYGRLKNDGAKPWFDEEDILPGQDWEREIRKAVRSCDVVLVCLSKSSVNRAGYLQKEIRFVLEVAEEKPQGTIFLIPARLELSEVPEHLRRWQWVDLFTDRGYEKLRDALQAHARECGIV